MNTDDTKEAEKVPADAPGYPLGGPEPKSRERLLAEQELAEEEGKAEEREAIDAAKEEIKSEAEAGGNPAPEPDPLA